MENSGGIQASLGGRYATALFDLAQERNFVSAVEADLGKLREGLSESADLAKLTADPRISRSDAGRAIDAVAGVIGLGELTRNFLKVLAANGRLADLPAIIRAFGEIAAVHRGEVSAEVVSAHPLDDAQIASLAAQLKAREGRGVKLTTRVDPEILGGLVVRLGSTMIDSSIRTRLNTLAQAMKG